MSKQWPEGELARRLNEAPPQNWTAEQWRVACTVLADGGSFEMAAEAIGLSKNKIIGIAHRRHFPKRESPIIVGGVAALRLRRRMEAKAARVAAREAERQAAAAARERLEAALRQQREVARQEREALRAEAAAERPAIPRGDSTPRIPRAPEFSEARAVLRFSDRGCMFPLGDPKEDDFRFCEAPDVVIGKSYCLHHCAVAYRRTDEEKARAAEVAKASVGTPFFRRFLEPRAA